MKFEAVLRTERPARTRALFPRKRRHRITLVVENGQPRDRIGQIAEHLYGKHIAYCRIPFSAFRILLSLRSSLLVRLAKVHLLDIQVALFVELLLHSTFGDISTLQAFGSSLCSTLHASSSSSAHRSFPSLLPALPQFDLKAIATATAKSTNQHRRSAVTRRLVANCLR